MPVIGTFTPVKDGYTGTIKTLTISAKVNITANDRKDSDGAPVLSFGILTDYFPKEMSGRTNAALNLLHLGCAFVLQSATGLVIEQCPESHGMHPPEAHQLAMAAMLCPQVVALGWFAARSRSHLRLTCPRCRHS